MEPLFVEAEVGVDGSERERRRALTGLAISATLCLAMPALALALDAPGVCAVTCVPALAMLMSLGFFSIAAAPGRAALLPGLLAIEDGHLVARTHDGRVSRRIPLADVIQGHREHPDLVHLATRAGETIVVRPAAEVEAACGRLLRVCGVRDRVLSVPLPSAAARVFGGRVLAGVALSLLFLVTAIAMLGVGSALRDAAAASGLLVAAKLGAALMLCLAPSFAMGYGLLRALNRREVRVGADSVVFRGALRTKRVSFDDVARIAPDPRGVRLHRRDGSSLLLPTSGEALPMPPRAASSGRSLPEPEARREVLLDRVRAVMIAREQGAFERPGLEALDRRGLSTEAWREQLATMARNDEGYRRANLSASDLGGVIEDAAAPVERRIAAALVLAASQPEEARRRVRIAAEAAADPDLRRAIERAAEGEIDEDVVDREAKRLAAATKGGR